MKKFPQTFPGNGKVSHIVISPKQRAEIDKSMACVDAVISSNYAIATLNAQSININR